jgi:hypothetical protein
MSKPNTRRLKLAEMRNQALEALDMDPGLELDLPNGDVVTVPNPMLAADDVQEKLNGGNVVDAAKAILGEDEHAKLVAGGGSSNDVILAWRLLSAEVEKRGAKS